MYPTGNEINTLTSSSWLAVSRVCSVDRQRELLIQEKKKEKKGGRAGKGRAGKGREGQGRARQGERQGKAKGKARKKN